MPSLDPHTSTARPGDPDASALDLWLPEFSVREFHGRVVAGSPEQALAVTLALPVAPDGIVRTLFRLRGLDAGRQSIAEFSSTGGFLHLQQTPTSIVFGVAGRFQGGGRQARSPQEWLEWTPPGLKIAADFRAGRAPDGRTYLSTETRVQGLDFASRALFRLYWLVIGPFSALIRRRWLRAIGLSCQARAR